MHTQPRIILETERLIFRPHIPADRDAFCAMEMDAGVRRYVGGYPRLREDAEKRFANTLNPPPGDLNMWATVLKTEGTYIGRCGLYHNLLPGGSYEPGVGVLGYYIASGYWGRGFATEAAAAFVCFGFDVLGVQKIITMVEIGNDTSVRILDKLGFYIESMEYGEKRSFVHYRLDECVGNAGPC